MIKSKFAILIPTDSWEKMEVYCQFLQTTTWASWGCAESKEYSFPVRPPFDVYFYHQNIIKYTAECFEIRGAGQVDFKHVPPVFSVDRKRYRNEFLLKNMVRVSDKSVYEVHFWSNPLKKITWGLREPVGVVNPFC